MIAQNTGVKFMSLFLRNIWYALPVLNSDTEIISKFSITEINIFYFFLEIILKTQQLPLRENIQIRSFFWFEYREIRTRKNSLF